MKIAVVTGGNRGIGFEICRQLGELGLKVVLTARNTDKGEAAVNQLKQQGFDVDFEQLEVGDEESTRQLAQRLSEKYDRIDALINNAGILPNSNAIGEVSIDEAKKVFDTNFFGPAMLIKALLPLLKKSGDARIINLSSGMGAFNESNGGHFAYRTSKTALNGLTSVVAHDLANTSIKINSMCPGWVKTDMGGESAPRTVAQGADTAVWLATGESVGSGKFYRNRREIKW